MSEVAELRGKVLPSGVECLHCQAENTSQKYPINKPGRPFNHLGGHLASIHGTNSEEYRNEHGLPPDTPLHTQQYANGRRKVASRPTNLERLSRFGKTFAALRRQNANGLLEQGLVTAGKAVEITGLTSETLRRAVLEGRLEAGIVCLVTFPPKHSGFVRFPGLPTRVIRIEDLNAFAKTFRSSRLRNQTMGRLAKFNINQPL